MRLTRLILVTFLCFLNSSCKQNVKKLVDEIYQTSTIDSALMLFKENPIPEMGYAYSARVKKLVQSNLDTQVTNRYIRELLDFSASKNQNYMLNLGEQCKTMQQFVLGNANSTRFWAHKMLESTSIGSNIDVSDVYHLVGIAYYGPPSKIDSTLKYWKLGFQKAVENNDGYRIYFFANNLGTIFYELDMYAISRQFFLKALNQAKKDNTVSPMLINNIVNTLVNANDYSGARDFFEAHKAYLQEIDPSNLVDQSIYLNRVYLNQRFGQLSQSSEILKSLSLSEVHATLKSKYISLSIGQYLYTKDTFFIRQEIKSAATESGIYLVHNLKQNLIDYRDVNLRFLWKIIEDDVHVSLENLSNDTRDSKALLKAIDLLIDKCEFINPVLCKKYSEAYVRIARLDALDGTDWQHYITEIAKVEDLFDGIIARNHEIETHKSNLRLLAMLVLLLIVISISAIIFYRIKIRSKMQKEAIWLKEKNLLVREKAMNQRMIEYSKELVSFNKKVKEDLDKLVLTENNSEFLKKFRSDLLGFISINLEQNPNVVDHTFDTVITQSEVDNHLWEELNKTEKRVFSMLKEGFKANEIARMLGVTTQYVYNVKARIRRRGITIE